jgi:hypothetical protein
VTYPPNPYEQQPPSGDQPQQPNPYGQLQSYQQPTPYQQPQPYQPPYAYGPQPGYGYPMAPRQEQGMAVASLVCSLLGIFFCLPAILGIIFGHVGYSKAKRGEAGGQGMAQAGMIIGYVICGLWLIPLSLWVIFGIAVLGGAAVG